MNLKTTWAFYGALMLLTAQIKAQNEVIKPKLDSLRESHIKVFKTIGITDTLKTIVRVTVKDTGNPGEPIQGATVVLRRDNDKMLGRVTKQDGRCNFMPLPADYTIRVQLTGYKTLESDSLKFEKGKVYELDLRVARN